jgi:hypothetical protein
MKVRAWSAIFLLACGCRMCQDPWDYSGPVQGSPSIPYAATTTRSGSVLNNGPIASTPTTAAPVVPQPPAAPEKKQEDFNSDPITMRPGSTSTLRR